MAAAMMPQNRKRRRTAKSKAKSPLETKTNFSVARLFQARTVLTCSTELEFAFLAGTKALDAAYGEAKG
jgi:hypothetical protein